MSQNIKIFIKVLVCVTILLHEVPCVGQGKFQWLTHPVSTNDDLAQAIYIDNSGSIYSVGCFKDTVKFANQIFISSRGEDGIILKYDSSGNEIWARQIFGGATYCVGIDGDSAGNIYVTGTFYDSVKCGQFKLNELDYDEGFLCKLDSNGDFKWAFQMGGYHVKPYCIRVDAAGNTYITGKFAKSLYFGSIFLNSHLYLEDDIFIGKVNTNGQAVWGKRAGSDGPFGHNDTGFGLDIDANGNSYVTGFFNDTCLFDSIKIIAKGEQDIFIAKYDNSGNILWVKRAGGKSNSDYDTGTQLVVRNDTSILLMGYASRGSDFDSLIFLPVLWSSAFISELDNNGNFKRIKGIANTTTTGWYIGNGRHLFINDQDDIYAVVSTDYWDNIPIGSYKIFGKALVKMDSAFNVLWCKPFQDIGGACYRNNSIFFTGRYYGSDTIDGFKIITSKTDMLTGKLNDASNKISGTVFEDIDGDTIFSIVDKPVMDDSIYIEELNVYLQSDSVGHWEAIVDTGIHTIHNVTPIGYQQIKPLSPINYSIKFLLTNEIKDSLDFGLLSITGFAENNKNQIIQIYPNPATTSFKIKLNKWNNNSEVIICNLLGKELFRKMVDSNEIEIQSVNLPSGIYLIQLRTQEANFVQKIIIE